MLTGEPALFGVTTITGLKSVTEGALENLGISFLSGYSVLSKLPYFSS